MTREELQAVGRKIVDLNNAKDLDGLMALYGPRVASVESMTMPGAESAVTRGKKAIKGKWDWWYAAHDIHAVSAEGPFLHGEDKVGVIFDMDVTNKASGQRMQARELAVYTVKDGKVVREEFYY